MATRQSQGNSGKWFFWALGLVVLVGAGWLLLAGRSTGEAEEPAPLDPTQTAGIEADPSMGVAIGPDDAVVTIYDFSDYLCPHCREFNGMVGKLLRRNYAVPGGPLRWVSYEFPLREESFPATVASTCAEEQGRYWEMHDMLFAKVESWASESNPNKVFAEIAGDLGMEKGEFKECIEKRKTASRILASKQYGVQLGVTGTPTIFVNGQAVPRTRQFYTYEGLEAFIQQQAAAAAGGAE